MPSQSKFHEPANDFHSLVPKQVFIKTGHLTCINRQSSAATLFSINNMTEECSPAKKRRISMDIEPFKHVAIPSVIDWNYDEEPFYISLGEGSGSAELPRVCKLIMNSEIFNRLHYIKQTGVCHYVFPDMTHTRFTHVTGTAAFAFRVVKKLQRQSIDGKPPMTGSEMLCVIIAALCHDLGHGPFSHLCEELFIQDDGSHFSHEEMSVILFDKMLLQDNEAIKTQLDKYFTDYHYKLIKDLINPPPFPEETDPWNLLVPPEKAFLYAIVNNTVTGLDVDKLEYLFRDSKRSGIIELSKENIDRFIKKLRICQIPDRKINWLAFPESDSENVRSIFDARKRLHSTVYSHKNVLAINEMFVRAFKLAGPHLTFDYGNEKVTLKQCFSKKHLDLYVQLTDDYLRSLIMFSTSKHPDMIKARQLIKDVECRRFFKAILSFDGLDKHYPCLKSTAIKCALKSCPLTFNVNDLFIIQRDFHGGKGLNVNPLKKVLFYSRFDETSASYLHRAPSIGESVVYIYAPYTCKESDVNEITKVLTEYAGNIHKNLRPVRKFRNNKENAKP
jgi:HD superfamily phosphohydrolase